MAANLLNTGIDGLDQILEGGLIPGRFYLVRGGPGTGKTTLGLHFLLEGKKNKEKLLLVSMTEDIEKLKEVKLINCHDYESLLGNILKKEDFNG